MSTFSRYSGGEPKYASLEEAHLMEKNAESDTELATPQMQSHVARLSVLVPWTISAVLLVLLAASWASKLSSETVRSSFEWGFDTELGEARVKTMLRPSLIVGADVADCQYPQNPKSRCIRFANGAPPYLEMMEKNLYNTSPGRRDMLANRVMRSMKPGIS